MTSNQLAKIVIAIGAAICLAVGLNWNAVDPEWADEGLLGLSLFLSLCTFILP